MGEFLFRDTTEEPGSHGQGHDALQTFANSNIKSVGQENVQNSQDARKFIKEKIDTLSKDVFKNHDLLSMLKDHKGTIGEFFNENEKKGSYSCDGFKFSFDESKDGEKFIKTSIILS